MMHKDMLVCCVKANGKVLREFKDEIYLPLGCEYSLYFKNLNSIRCSIDVTIDGKPLITSGYLVLNANSSVEVERWVSDNSVGNKLRFIERTSKIEGHRGVKSEDGLVRVAFKYERVFKIPDVIKHETHIHHHHQLDHKPWTQSTYPPIPIWYGTESETTGGISGSSTFSAVAQSVPSALRGTVSGMALNSVKTASSNASNLKAEHPLQNDVGITVEGSKSTQEFKTTAWFPLEDEEHVMVLKLLGDLGQNKKVEKPVTVKSKITCGTCGTRTKPTARFCPDCGTAVGLELVA